MRKDNLHRIMRIGKEIDLYFNNDNRKEINSLAKIVIILLALALIATLFVNQAKAYTLDEWADAIFRAEGGYSATYLYGIRSIPYETEEQARRYCKNTVRNTLIKYRSERCKEGESDIDCLSRRYCPIGANNDPKGLNKNWKKNVLFFLEKGQK